MPVQHEIWRVGDHPERLPGGQLNSEQQLEEMIVANTDILSRDWMLIGRQEATPFGGVIDLLAVAPDGSLVLIELKRGKTSRQVVAQALDYASWVKQLEVTEIAEIYRRFKGDRDLAKDFIERFNNVHLEEEEWNQSHQIVIVAAELDDSTERITKYLRDEDVFVNVLFFQVFKNGNDKLLSRAWLVDPSETQLNRAGQAKVQKERQPWNGEYYVSYGRRSWEDARLYGYVSGGGGTFYSRSLNMLSPGDRIWVNLPGEGYAGVGRVKESRRPIFEFEVKTKEGKRPALEILENAAEYRKRRGNPEEAEYVVRVEWLDSKPKSEAVWEVGFFANQNTVCRPKTTKWSHTVGRLKTLFPNWQG